MILKVTYSALARKDLENIRKWTLENFGVKQSDAYIRQVDATVRLVAENPGLARDASLISPELKKFTAAEHIAYFRVTCSSNAVVRILHGKMDTMRWI